MRVLVRTIALTIPFLTLPLFSRGAQAAPNCEITSCRYGGPVSSCWKSMSRELQSKRKACTKIAISTGYSAHAMATSLPQVCIKPTAVIHIHRPFRAGQKAVAIGSRWHNYYFGRIKSPAVSYFRRHGGMQREGWSNAYSLIPVPAQQTGLPMCKI